VNVLVVFTFGYSLKTWFDSSTLNKEISIYKNLHEKEGVNFTFLTYGNYLDKELIKEKGMSVIPIYEFLQQTDSKIKMFFDSLIFPLRFKKKLENIDLIKQHQISGVWLSIVIKILLGKPLYTRTGYDMHLFAKHQNKSLLIRGLYYISNQLGLIFSNLFTVSNSYDLINTKKTYLFTKNISIRTNWIIKKDFYPFEERRDNAIVSVGRIENQKNFFELIENFSKSNIEIHIFGNGSLENELLEYAKKNEVRLVLEGSVSNEILQSKLREYKYFISTSLYEGNPKSVIEALANGCLVFASDIPNHHDLITHNKNGFLFRLGNFDLKKQFFEVLEESSKFKKISQNAFEESIKSFELNVVSSKEFEDYNLLLNHSK